MLLLLPSLLCLVAHLQNFPFLITRIRLNLGALNLLRLMEELRGERHAGLKGWDDGVLFSIMINYMFLKWMIVFANFVRTHCTPYVTHPSANKMYHNPQRLCWWDGMKKDVVWFVCR